MPPRARVTRDVDLLGATHRVVSRLGSLRMTIADVAAEAGVSPATLLQRFGSKQGLLWALAASGTQRLAAEFAQIRAAHPSPLSAFDAIIDAMTRAGNTPELLSNGLGRSQIDQTDPELHKHALAHAHAMRAEIASLLDAAIEAGELVRCDTTRLARAVQAILDGARLQWAFDRDGKIGDRLREELDTLLRPRRCSRERRRRPRRKITRY